MSDASRLYLFFAIQDYYPAGGMGDCAGEARHATEDDARTWADGIAGDPSRAGMDMELWVVDHDETRQLEYRQPRRQP